MLLYEDILSGDELFSDAFPVYDPSLVYWILDSYLYSKEVDDIVYEVDCQLIIVKPGADIDIGQIQMSLFSYWCRLIYVKS